VKDGVGLNPPSLVSGAVPAPRGLGVSGLTRMISVALMSVLAFALNLWGIATPEPWRDEAATWMSTQRSLGDLLSMLRSVDAVHGVYYLGVRLWILPFGDSVFSLRALSALGVAVGVALVMQLGHHLFGWVAALGAGISYAVLPPLTWAATEARSYAWAGVLSCMVALAFWVAHDRGGWRPWLVYSVTVIVAVHGFVYNALVVVAAVGLSLAWLRSGQRIRAAVATAGALVACVPFALLVASQGSQVSWLNTYPVTVSDVTMAVFWGTEDVSQIVGTSVLVVALGFVAQAWWSGRSRGQLAYVVGWLVLPLAMLLALHPVLPLYHRRYLLVSIPALALVLGFLVARLRWVWLRVLLVMVLVAGCVPGYLHSREPLSKLTPGPAIRELAKRAKAGDGIYVVGSDENGLAWAFPVPIASMVDLSTPLDDRWRASQLYSASVPVQDLGNRLESLERVWLWSDIGELEQTEAAFALQGFDFDRRFQAKDHYRTVLVLLQRSN